MTTNRLTGPSSGPPDSELTRMTALEWAKLAREKGLNEHAEAWEKAHLDGWDTRNHAGEPKWAAAMRKYKK